MTGDDVHFIWFSELDHGPIATPSHGGETNRPDAAGQKFRREIRSEDDSLCTLPAHSMTSAMFQVPDLPDEAHEYMYNIIIGAGKTKAIAANGDRRMACCRNHSGGRCFLRLG